MSDLPIPLTVGAAGLRPLPPPPSSGSDRTEAAFAGILDHVGDPGTGISPAFGAKRGKAAAGDDGDAVPPDREDREDGTVPAKAGGQVLDIPALAQAAAFVSVVATPVANPGGRAAPVSSGTGSSATVAAAGTDLRAGGPAAAAGLSDAGTPMVEAAGAAGATSTATGRSAVAGASAGGASDGSRAAKQAPTPAAALGGVAAAATTAGGPATPPGEAGAGAGVVANGTANGAATDPTPAPPVSGLVAGGSGTPATAAKGDGDGGAPSGLGRSSGGAEAASAAPQRMAGDDAAAAAAAPTAPADPVTGLLATVGTPAQQVLASLRTMVTEPRATAPASATAPAGTPPPAPGAVKTLTVNLNPDQLGPVSITLRMQAGAVDIRIAVSTPQALHQLEQDKHVLSAAVAALGGGSGSLHLGSNPEGAGSPPQQSNASERPNGFSSDAASTGRQSQGQARSTGGPQRSETDDTPEASVPAPRSLDGSLYL